VYIVRRLVLTVALLALLTAGGYLVYRNLPFKLAVVPADAPATPADAVPQAEPESPSSVPAPEPEPEAPPVTDDGWQLILANAENPLPDGYGPPELAEITPQWHVDSRIDDPVLKMLAEAREDGVSLVIVSAYRPEEKQRELFLSKTQEFVAAGRDEAEAAEAAATIVARPGTSEHQTGLALDIVTADYTNLDEGFADTPAAKWLFENAGEYGFILRYPADKTEITGIIFEPWHYRYVGVENARAMREKAMCLEEYSEYLREPE
jgi:D-alanyl-D-alanine carboxypeptidase